MRYVLFYLPPCDKWYVHSHKLYDTPADAVEAAKKFLPDGTAFSVVPVTADTIEYYRNDATAPN